MGEKHTPGPWSLCHHLKSMEHDTACSCGYRGVVYGPEHDAAFAICQPGHELPRREEEWGTEPARYPREVELANMRLIAAAPTLKDACAAAEDFIATIDSDAARAIYVQLHAALQVATPTDTKPTGEGATS